MTLDDYLLPEEEIIYRSPEDIEYGGERYIVYITDKRLLLYARRGLILKKDDIISEKIGNIQTVNFKEHGLFFKIGVIEVITERRKWQFQGNAKSMKALFTSIQEHLAL